MAPEMVLTREQKTIRFRKLLLKKQNQKGRSRSGNRNTESESSTVAADADDDELGGDQQSGADVAASRFADLDVDGNGAMMTIITLMEAVNIPLREV